MDPDCGRGRVHHRQDSLPAWGTQSFDLGFSAEDQDAYALASRRFHDRFEAIGPNDADCSAAELFQFIAIKFADVANRQLGQSQRPNRNPLEAFYFMTDASQDAANLAVAPFGQHDFQLRALLVL